jgi:hypothetical protein
MLWWHDTSLCSEAQPRGKTIDPALFFFVGEALCFTSPLLLGRAAPTNTNTNNDMIIVGHHRHHQHTMHFLTSAAIDGPPLASRSALGTSLSTETAGGTSTLQVGA